MKDDLECPYCGAGQDVNHDDGAGYEEGVSDKMECESCHKNFVFTTSITYHYKPEKADCLNGSPHRYSEWQSWRKCYDCDHVEYSRRRRCYDCDHVEMEQKGLK